MIFTSPTISADELAASTGWDVQPHGACKGDACVPLPGMDPDALELQELARRLRMTVAADETEGLWALGPECDGQTISDPQIPDIELPDRHGNPFRLSSLRGKKVVLVTWASWCGCRFDLPVWQELRTELAEKGVEIVTVALDVGGAEAAGPFIDAAKPDHPALIDVEHSLDAQLGIVNVPMSVWIDEEGRIVRPPEQAWPGRAVFNEMPREQWDELLPEEARPYFHESLDEAHKIKANPEQYVAALRDWAEQGADSRFALDEDEVAGRSMPRTEDRSRAAAHWEIGQRLHRDGKSEAAVPHFRRAHELQPENWTYKREAWGTVNPLQGPSEQYDSDFVSEIRKVGAENYYAQSPDLSAG
ncbi:ResA-like WAxxUGC motif-containing protein [Patulibacter minatonensis]|uniref:ResA-like WAxxUGC motif-containing protein n=1 Tax=Patulibacter minatonensis TaxID=298163 RepID=UPI00056C2EA7|nr:ResA-like WAxxUGC motif-containing protein [Patulibacter minatonensis]